MRVHVCTPKSPYQLNWVRRHMTPAKQGPQQASEYGFEFEQTRFVESNQIS